MVFSELTFLYIFLPVCLILSLCLKNTAAKNAALLIMSLLFYAWGEPVYVLLMIATSPSSIPRAVILNSLGRLLISAVVQ